MKTPNLRGFFMPVNALSSDAISRQLLVMNPHSALDLIGALKEASIRDQLFEQAASFRNAERALAVLMKEPKRKRAASKSPGLKASKSSTSA